MRSGFVAAALTALLGLSMQSGHAYEVKQADIVVQDPWTNATLRPNLGNAIYMVIGNAGRTPLHLIGASTPAARAATLHQTVPGDDGVVRMVRVIRLEIPPGDTAVLEPNGLHIMLTTLAAPLAEGQTVPLTLTFERPGAEKVDVTVDAMVESVRATEPRRRPNP